MPGQSSAEEETQWAAAHTLVQPDDGRTLILNALNAAKTSIDLTIYEINDSQIMSALAAAKARKVTARVIYNWYSFPADMQQRQITPAIQQLTKVGIQCQQAPRTFEVTHEKAFVIDGTTGIIMSFNLTSEYFGMTRDFGIVTTVGPEVTEIAIVFEADWNDKPVTPKEA
jgi:phosphatidylserine/phosphatidylglycerophosphate/cardiolipin synthase-like enzyme